MHHKKSSCPIGYTGRKGETRTTYKMKLNYNGLIKEIVEALESEDIEYLQENAWHIEIGIQLLNGYLNELAEHTIETQDEWLVEWCKNLLIITETEEKGGNTACMN